MKKHENQAWTSENVFDCCRNTGQKYRYETVPRVSAVLCGCWSLFVSFSKTDTSKEKEFEGKATWNRIMASGPERCTFWSASWPKTVYLGNARCKFKNASKSICGGQIDREMTGTIVWVPCKHCCHLESINSTQIGQSNQSSGHPTVSVTGL